MLRVMLVALAACAPSGPVSAEDQVPGLVAHLRYCETLEPAFNAPSYQPIRKVSHSITSSQTFVTPLGEEADTLLELPILQSFVEPPPAVNIGRYFWLKHTLGAGLGQDEPSSNFAIFQPLFKFRQDDVLSYLDVRLILDNNSDLGTNLGIGLRRYNPKMNRIHGIHFWYDVDDRHQRIYRQVTAGLESLGQNLDVRANVYFPVGERLFFDEMSLTGLDLEVGARVPGSLSAWLFVGWYSYEGPVIVKTNGIMGSIEGYIMPNLSVQLAVTDDQEFSRSVLFSVTWYPPSFCGPRGGNPCNVYDRLDEPVRRNPNIVISRGLFGDPSFGGP